MPPAGEPDLGAKIAELQQRASEIDKPRFEINVCGRRMGGRTVDEATVEAFQTVGGDRIIVTLPGAPAGGVWLGRAASSNQNPAWVLDAYLPLVAFSKLQEQLNKLDKDTPSELQPPREPVCRCFGDETTEDAAGIRAVRR